jgi:ribosomal protein S18 acetylase RimI-like enzyme
LNVELRPASTLSLAEQTELFNAGYEEYVIPMRLNDETALRWMIDSFDIDRDASRIAVRGGERLGFANLAIRGDEAWVGGVGVVPAARRQGIGELLMRALHDEARARGIARIWLEVIEQNDGAFRLYEKLGYDVVRPLEVWTIPKRDAPEDSSTREVNLEQAQARVRELRATREPWQRADATVANFTDALGIESDEGAAVFRVKGAVQLIQIAGTARELVETVRSHGDTILLNLPPDDPAADALPGLGGGVMLRQREMVLEL